MAAPNSKEVILRLQYPEEVGAVGECELEGILSRLQREESLWQYGCTLGAPITNPDSDATDSASAAQKRGPPRGAVLLAVEGDVSKSYYCRTAPAYNDAQPPPPKGSGTSPFTPTILVEMYTNFVPLPDESNNITKAINDVVMDCLVKQKNISQDAVMVRVLKYTLAST